MDSAYTIVVPDNEILARLCGSNDSNLVLIEEHLGVPVFTRGNELSISESDTRVCERFKHIIDRITDEVTNGHYPDSHMVYSILNVCPKNTDLTDKELRRLFAKTSICIPEGFRNVYPKTNAQAELVDAMRTHDMVFCMGPAGSGKTYLMIAEALNLIMQRKKSRIVLTRPVVEAGESLGFLPGDLEQKISPYLRPLYDAMESLISREHIRKLIDSGIIDVAPLAYMRGRTLSDSVIILDEAQNTTAQQMKMFLTRMGEGSKVFISGDITQTDLPKHIVSGLKDSMHVLRNIEEIKKIYFTSSDVVRNELVKKIIQAYEDHE
ncbi:MAG: PhoH family protein [Spirochaetales bacterium]